MSSNPFYWSLNRAWSPLAKLPLRAVGNLDLPPLKRDLRMFVFSIWSQI